MLKMTQASKNITTHQAPIENTFFLNEDFSNLLDEYEKDTQKLTLGTVVKGVIVGIDDKGAAIDIGAKSIGYIQIAEFKPDGEINEGDVIDVFLEKLEDKRGELVISRDNARRLNNWNSLKQALEDKSIVEGTILGRVKGGYAVDYNGVTTFLPGSQVDTMLLSDDSFLIGKLEKLMVLKIDEIRGNIVVSRRAILEGQREEERAKILSGIKIGDVLDGVIKNLTDYGAFIDFGSFDGLLHLTDISWCRVRHPSEVLTVGQDVKVQVIKYDEKSKRVSLGMKQLQENPWESIEKRYPVSSTVKGRVTNIANYGAFVEIENGIEGLVHVSEMSWFKNNLSPNKILEVNQEIEVMILEINPQNHRISLGIKQCSKNPWQKFSDSFNAGDITEGIVKNSTEFGLFVGFESGVDGLVHLSDITHDDNPLEKIKEFKKDDKINVMVLGSNFEKERISLGIKQLENKDFKKEFSQIKIGSDVSGFIMNVKKDFLELELDLGLKAVIKKLDISSNKKDQRTDNFTVGDKVDGRITQFNNVTGKIMLSIKDLEVASKESYTYSKNTPSGATLGSILGDVLQESRSRIEKEEENSKTKDSKKETTNKDK